MDNEIDVGDFTLWIGWLYGDEADREYFRSLGVFGPMAYKESDNTHSVNRHAHEKVGIFSHCWAYHEGIERLRAEYLAFSETFSEVGGNELSNYLKEHVVFVDSHWYGEEQCTT